MKTMILTATLLLSGAAFGKDILKGAGEQNNKECECMTCLIKTGICPSSHPNEDRVPIDKSARKPAKKKGGTATSTAQ